MKAEGELIRKSLLTTEVEDADLGVWHTTAVPRLGVRPVLAVPVAPRGAWYITRKIRHKFPLQPQRRGEKMVMASKVG